MQQIPPKNGWPSAKLYSVTDVKTIILVLTKILKIKSIPHNSGVLLVIYWEILHISVQREPLQVIYIYIYTHIYVHTYIHTNTKLLSRNTGHWVVYI